jgi:hypothetical protein
MIETLTTVFVVLSLLAFALIGLLVYLLVRHEGSGECPNCGGSGRAVVHNRAGLMSTRCPVCNR